MYNKVILRFLRYIVSYEKPILYFWSDPVKTTKKASSKDRIFSSAKILFYEKGYHATSLVDISKAAKVNKAMIAYYYNSKSQLAFEICMGISADIRAALKASLEQLDLYDVDRVLASALEYRTFAEFRKLNPNYRRFIRELSEDNVLLLSESTDRLFGEQLYLDLKDKYNIEYTEVEIRILHYSATASLGGLILMHDLGHIDCGHDYLAEKECFLLYRTLGLPDEVINEMLDQSKELKEQIHLKITKNFHVE